MNYMYTVSFFMLAVLHAYPQITVGDAADYADTDCLNWMGDAGWVWQQDRPVDTLPVQVSRGTSDSPGINVFQEGGILVFRNLERAEHLAVRTWDGRTVWSSRININSVRTVWDLTDGRGGQVNSGIYFIDVTFSDGSRASSKVCVFRDNGGSELPGQQ